MENNPEKKMKSRGELHKIFVILFFNIVFGLDEAVVVVYLREMLQRGKTDFFMHLLALGQHAELFSLGIIAFLTPQSFAGWANYNIEQLREVGTMVMLLALGYVAGRNLKEKAAYFFLSFGVWDIFYYIWLYILIGWPKSLSDLDILFLLPVPWVAPVVLPVFISLFMVIISIYYLKKATDITE
ncbi:hypothetical protein M1271_04295 [Patescibacteria group bacterium]|nr:hypothetical protein [Patescibacteria group bacterium]